MSFESAWLRYKAMVVDQTVDPDGAEAHALKLAFYGGATAFDLIISSAADMPEHIGVVLWQSACEELKAFAKSLNKDTH
jgi:hypothetical protein